MRSPAATTLPRCFIFHSDKLAPASRAEWSRGQCCIQSVRARDSLSKGLALILTLRVYSVITAPFYGCNGRMAPGFVLRTNYTIKSSQ